jgi:hypothetical protein
MAVARPIQIALLVVMLALAGSGPARAQAVPEAPTPPRVRQPVILGLQAGYSESGFVGGDGTASENRAGTLFGVFVDRRLTGPLQAQFELFFAKKGGGFTSVVGDVPVRISAQLVYLELPVLARLAIPVGSSRFRPVLFGGGSVSFNIGCEFQAEIPGQAVQVGCNDSAGVGIPLREVDFGLIAGGGFEYRRRGTAFRLEFRQVFGQREVLADDVLKNRTWAILFGFTF